MSYYHDTLVKRAERDRARNGLIGFALVGIFAGVLIGGAVAGVWLAAQRHRADAAAAVAAAAPRFGYAAYDRAAVGMRREQLDALAGFAGREVSSSRVEFPGVYGGIETEIFAWANPDGSNMTATFQDGRMIAKAQLGLR